MFESNVSEAGESMTQLLIGLMRQLRHATDLLLPLPNAGHSLPKNKSPTPPDPLNLHREMAPHFLRSFSRHSRSRYLSVPATAQTGKLSNNPTNGKAVRLHVCAQPKITI
ncbi:hypothetical protein [Pseudomonas sp. NA-150]|uniref:hypothetical protein n=1 Tax=Pseudomonas sp. NA-150 TaxID=3367525 RepID=UPI0037CB5BD1